MAEFAPSGTTIEIASIAEIPLYDQDEMDASGPPAGVVELQDRLAAADGLLIATPEYNNSIPGVAKNAIDWLSRPASSIPRVFGDLPVALIGAGGRSGTRFSQAAWLPVLRVLGTRPWFESTFYATGAAQLFDEGGILTDEQTRELLRDRVVDFARYCEELPRRR
jgi:chromate reductase